MQTFETLTDNTCPIFPTISIVIGAWGSYNACNERALGSTWLDLSDFSDWEEITQELKKQGFDLNGIDEELFVQDIDGIPASATNWDYVHPQALFVLLQQSSVLLDNTKYEKMQAYIEVCSLGTGKHLSKNIMKIGMMTSIFIPTILGKTLALNDLKMLAINFQTI